MRDGLSEQEAVLVVACGRGLFADLILNDDLERVHRAFTLLLERGGQAAGLA